MLGGRADRDHGVKARRHDRAGDSISAAEWKSIPITLENDRKVYFDKIKNNLLYILPGLDGDRSIKLAVEVNFVTKRPKQTINLARSGFKINVQALQDRTRYEEIL